MPDEGFQPTTTPIHVVQAPSARRTLVLAACLMATFMAAVESSIVATAMPTIVADLGGFNLFSWVFAVYLLTQAVSIPVYGRLADIYGRKKVFYFGAGLFLVGSTLCGFAGNMVALILFRALQGFGAGGVQPIATTILGDIYTPTERAHVQGLVSSVFGVAAVLGPLLGAFLVEQVSWQLVFWVNLPIGVAAIVMIATFLTEPTELHPRRIDYLGSLLLMVAITALMLVLVQGGSLSHATLAIVGAIAIATFVALAVHESSTAEPMLPLDLWRQHRIIAIGSFGGAVISAVMTGVSAFLPTYVQGAMGRSALTGGLVLGAMSVTWALASFYGGRLMVRTTYRLTAVLGTLALIAGSTGTDHPDAGARPGVGQQRIAADRYRHGALQHHVHRIDPGRGAMAPAGRCNVVVHVPALRRPVVGGGVVRCRAEPHAAARGAGHRGPGGSIARSIPAWWAGFGRTDTVDRGGCARSA